MLHLAHLPRSRARTIAITNVAPEAHFRVAASWGFVCGYYHETVSFLTDPSGVRGYTVVQARRHCMVLLGTFEFQCFAKRDDWSDDHFANQSGSL